MIDAIGSIDMQVDKKVSFFFFLPTLILLVFLRSRQLDATFGRCKSGMNFAQNVKMRKCTKSLGTDANHQCMYKYCDPSNDIVPKMVFPNHSTCGPPGCLAFTQHFFPLLLVQVSCSR
jgi:hypothetical protein